MAAQHQRHCLKFIKADGADRRVDGLIRRLPQRYYSNLLPPTTWNAFYAKTAEAILWFTLTWAYFSNFCGNHDNQALMRNTWGEMTSQYLWLRYDRHFVGITWHNVELRAKIYRVI